MQLVLSNVYKFYCEHWEDFPQIENRHIGRKIEKKLRNFLRRNFRCLASIGLKHAHLVQTLAVELLGVTPVFDMQEQSIEDEICMSLISILRKLGLGQLTKILSLSL